MSHSYNAQTQTKQTCVNIVRVCMYVSVFASAEDIIVVDHMWIIDK